MAPLGRQCCLLMGVFALGLIGCDPIGDANSSPDRKVKSHQEADSEKESYRDRLGRLKYERDKLIRSVDRLKRDRKGVIDQLHAMGISSSSDLSNHAEAEYEARELTQIVGAIQEREARIAEYESVIRRVEIILRRQDRQARLEHSAPSEADLKELSEALHTAEEDLRPGSDLPLVDDLRMEQVLDEEL